MVYIIFSALICIAVIAVAINSVESFKRKKKKELSFKDSLHLTGLPILIFNQGSKTYNFLLDTGSNRSHINKSIIDNNVIKYSNENSTIEVYGMEGNARTSNMCKIDLEMNGITFNDLFVVNDLDNAFSSLKEDHGVTLHGILGTSFFEKYKYVIDFNKYIAYSYGKRN